MPTSAPPARVWEDTDGKVDIFVAGVGTGGCDRCRRVPEGRNPNVKVVAVEPASSPVLSKGHCGRAQDSGHRRRLCARRAERKVYDEIIPVTNEDAFATGKQGRPQGGRAGRHSSGAAIWAAIQLAKRPSENKGKTIVAPAARHR